MDGCQEAVDPVETRHSPGEAEPDVLEEDVFQQEVASCHLAPLHAETLDFPDTPTGSLEEMSERRLVVLKGILESEEVYLRELDALLMPMKALRASAGTSQPVLSSRQIQTVFYQLPELREMHQSFYSGLKARMSVQRQASPHLRPQQGAGPEMMNSGEEAEVRPRGFELMVGDLFQKMVNQIGVYGGFIGNYEEAVEIVRKRTQSDSRFRTLAESMMTTAGSDGAGTKCTFEALLYKPLDRVTKTTLVLHEVLRTTPTEHQDYATLQEALRLSQSFLSGVNESSRCRREVALSHGMRRKLERDGFVVDASERRLRHVFLYTDLLLCTRVKPAARGKQDQYRFCWYLLLSGLKLRWVPDQERSPDAQLRLHTIRTKMYLLRQQLREQHEGPWAQGFAARSRKKLEQLELMLLTLSPVHKLELHSPSGKSHTLLLSSVYELEEWREAIHKLTADNTETVPPDLLTLTSSCVKLRMTQQPPLRSSKPGDGEEALCGTLTVAIHAARGLQQAACVYWCVEVDGHGLHDGQAQTHSSVRSLNPHWDQELLLQVDGARTLRLLCVSQCDGRDDAVLGKTSLKLESEILKRWRRRTLRAGPVEVTVSLKFSPHPPDPPSAAAQQQPVFCVPIETVAQQEGLLVPHVVRCCAEEVERRGLDEVGMYRVSGSASDIGRLKAAFNSNLREAVARLRRAEVNTVSGVLKLYFRELPEPLIPTELFQSLARTLDIQDVSSRLVSLLSLLHSCPEPNRHTFLYLLRHLQRVSEKQAVNKMSLHNLATVFGPSLLRPPVAGGGHSGPTMDISQEVEVQVQVVLCYLQCSNLPEAQITLPYDTDAEDETTHM